MPQLKTQHHKDTRKMGKNAQTKEEQTKFLNTKFNSRYSYDENEDCTVERDQNVNETFNYEKRVVEDGAGTDIIAAAPSSFDHVISDGTSTSDRINGARDVTLEHTYENLSYDLNGSKEILLHKFFRSTDRGDAIYANLCRGCGYGVFEAHGELCYFCASIVNGVRDTPTSIDNLSAEHLNLVNNSANVYENICENCYAIYSSDECVNCETDLKTKSKNFISKVKKQILVSDLNDSKNETNVKSVKLIKSKSFNKRSEKRSIFQGLIGSLKRSSKSEKSINSNSAPRLEIIHNVDGYENVFRTQETFDLQRICELKRTQTSSSEQHIYGRLKCAKVQKSQSNSELTENLPHQLIEIPKADSVNGYLNTASVTVSQSSLLNDEDYNIVIDLNRITKDTKATETTTTTTTTTKKLAGKACKSGKRPRISKPRLLRSITGEQKKIIQEKAAVDKQQALYLPDSVCNWMTSLRSEVHNYQSYCGNDETIGLCNPKSIPAKNSLSNYYLKTPGIGDIVLLNNIGAIKDITTTLSSNELTNYTNIECLKTTTTPKIVISNKNVRKSHSKKLTKSDVSSQSSSETNSSNYDEIVTLREPYLSENLLTIECDHADNSPVELDQMVNEFKQNLLARQYKKQMSKDTNEIIHGAETQLDSRCGNDNFEEKILMSKVNTMKKIELENRDQSRQELRARRQAIYMKVDEHKVNENKQNNNNSTNTFNNNNDVSVKNCWRNEKTYNSNNENNNSMKTASILSELDSTISVESPVSRRKTVESCISSNGVGTLNGNNRKRCGIYEPNVDDSTFVSDIFKFLQNEEDIIASKETEEDKISIISTKTKTQIHQQSNDSSFITASSSLSTLSHSQITPYVAAQQQQQGHHQDHLETRQCSIPASLQQIFNFVKVNENLHLSRSLNNIIINYQQPLHAFLLAIRVRYPCVYKHYTQTRLVRKYWRFHEYYIRKLSVKPRARKYIKNYNQTKEKTNGSEKCDTIFRHNQIENVSKTMADNNAFNAERNSVKIIVQQLEVNCAKSISSTKSEVSTNKVDNSGATNETYMTSADRIDASTTSINTDTKKESNQISLKPDCVAPKKIEPPQVPLRDPKTSLSVRNINKTTPPLPIKSESLNNKMTIPTLNSNAIQNSTQTTKQQNSSDSDENIYQPIWKFKTVGEVQERYQTDVDYYEIGNDTTTGLNKQAENNNDDSLPAVLISNDVEDHGEWETDDEFLFTTEMMSDKISLDPQSSEINSLNSSTALNSIKSSSSLSGSTVAGFSSSTATLASAISSSLTHHLLRNIGIFYSLTEPKLRAIIYDYDRVHASAYFAKRNIQQSQNQQQQNQQNEQQQHQQQQQQLPKSTSPCSHNSIESNANDSGFGKSLEEERLPTPPPRTTSVANCPTNIPKKFSESRCQSMKVSSEPLLPDSVQAWKFMLLDVNYLEDEEDMIVSETEILRSQEIKEDIDTRQTQQLNILQRFKSASFGNLVDLPNEDDKKSIAERMRNKLQRGVFKLNVRSPKSDKKNRGIFRRAEATSLYLEDGMKPKYPIFGAPLEQLELDQCTYHNVPRFVVDCVAYIEQKDCILQEGLYRASGNKVSIEELKQKLSESYIYDPKLLIIDDIHTLTSLLKLFFRELGAPLIPQETYERLGRNLSDAATIETMREAFDDMREPNRSTLKFLIRHLTNVAACSSENRMPASNLAIVWGPCIMSANQIEFDIGRMNTLAKVLIENYARIFNESERLVA